MRMEYEKLTSCWCFNIGTVVILNMQFFLVITVIISTHFSPAANGAISNVLVGSVEFVDGRYDLQYFPNESIATLWPST